MFRHIPVLLKETIESLKLQPGKNVVDCTLGDGGHAEAMLEKTAPKGKLLGIDADVESILRAKRFLYRFGERVIYARDNFVNLKKILEENKFGPAWAILMDLGWSSPQFEERGRGFSFLKDEPLDMRYGTKLQITNYKLQINETAADIVNNASADELGNIFRMFGEERLGREIAEAVVEARREKRMERTGELVDVILRVYRKKLKSDKKIPWIGGLHPATKVFQALRIAVNNELEALKQALPQALEALAPGGRLAVISFHSLEDRIVKQFFQKEERAKALRLVNKKPLTAGPEEVINNPRSRSAKLRVIEKM